MPTEDGAGMVYGDQVIGEADYLAGWNMLRSKDGVKPKDASPLDEMECEGGINIANNGNITTGIAQGSV